LHCNRLVGRLDRLGDFGGDCVRRKEYGRVSGFGQLYSFCLRVDEFLAPISARVEPCAQRFRLARRSFSKCDHGLVGGFEAIVRDSQNRGIDSLFVLAEDLDDVAIGLRIQNLEHISAGGQYAPPDQMNAWNFHRAAKGDHGFPVPIVRLGAWRQNRAY
jgi:hypothetical protein